MSVHTGISGGSCEVLAVSVRDVFTGLGVSESLGEAEVNDINVMLLLPDTNQKVVGLDISVQEVPRVNKFISLDLQRLRREYLLPSNQRA